MSSWDDSEAREHVARTEALLSGLEALADPLAREQARDTVHAVAELYGECLARVLRHADAAATAAIVADELVSHLLLVHELHPEPVERRVRRALGDMRGVDVLAVEESEVRVRLAPAGCGAPSVEQLAESVRKAVAWAAPEIERVGTESPAPDTTTLITVDSLFRGGQPAGKG